MAPVMPSASSDLADGKVTVTVVPFADLGRDIQRTAVHGNDFLRHGKADAAAALLDDPL